MVEINPEGQLTRKERLAAVIALAASLFFHLFVFFGGLQLYHWVEEEKKKERLMVIRRVRDVSPEPMRGGKSPSRPQPPPDAKVAEPGPEPPKETPEHSGSVVEENREAEGVPPLEPEDDKTAENSVSVITDLSAATFTVSGPVEFRGAGTFWIKKGAPPGEYTATFHPVTGYNTPSIQSKSLAEGGKIVFVGRYTRSVEVVVNIGVKGVTFEIYRPDGLILGMNQAGRAFFENLPFGSYTIVYHGVPGYVTPSPQSRTLGEGESLVFSGDYRPVRKELLLQLPAPVLKAEAGLDRRVQMVIKSYPPTSIEEEYGYIAYPEIIIKRSNFQKGWCQVYLILSTDDQGRIVKVIVQRPQVAERDLFERLIRTVESAARSWSYDMVAAEVHVDVRFYVE